MGDFDIISGWSGVRLSRCVDGPVEDDRTLALLRWLLADDTRWCCVHPLRPNDPPENDLGLAHGVAGVLAAIALSTLEVDDAFAALLGRQAQRLRDRVILDGDTFAWPAIAQTARVPSRPTWCYGGPGVASALYWVARLLSDAELEAFALAALEAQADVPCSQWRQTDYALCHGTLGNALIFASVGGASRRPKLLTAAGIAVEYAVDGLERDEAACWALLSDKKPHDLSGELDGAAGIALSLLTLIGDADSRWLRCHALKPGDEFASSLDSNGCANATLRSRDP
jgi:hypothetical protein